MRFLAPTVAIILALTGSARSAATPPNVTPTTGIPDKISPLTVEKYDGETSGKYIVQLKEGVDRASLLSKVKQANGQVTYGNWKIINAFAGDFPGSVLDLILASPDVESVTQDGVATIAGIQDNAPWGLARISDTLTDKDPNAQKYFYVYPDDRAGSGVDIYVVDTGVRISHNTFQGRARWGATFGKGYQDVDDSGHGTHVAGVAAGFEYGIAKKADIIAVKVLDSSGAGYITDIISGLDWVLNTVSAQKTTRPSVVNLSFTAAAHKGLDDAVRRLTADGIHVAVSAGNSNKDASALSPARVLSAVTVASSNITDEKDAKSNYGSVVKLFAPGRTIISAWNTANDATKKVSGTSIATPHVSGLIAYFIIAEGNLCPTDMIKKLQKYAKKDVLKGVPQGTPNFLAQNRQSDLSSFGI